MPFVLKTPNVGYIEWHLFFKTRCHFDRMPFFLKKPNVICSNAICAWKDQLPIWSNAICSANQMSLCSAKTLKDICSSDIPPPPQQIGLNFLQPSPILASKTRAFLSAALFIICKRSYPQSLNLIVSFAGSYLVARNVCNEEKKFYKSGTWPRRVLGCGVPDIAKTLPWFSFLWRRGWWWPCRRCRRPPSYRCPAATRWCSARSCCCRGLAGSMDGVVKRFFYRRWRFGE